MGVRHRLLALHLIKKQEQCPEYFEKLGISVWMRYVPQEKGI